jgi:hypothetical protein
MKPFTLRSYFTKARCALRDIREMHESPGGQMAPQAFTRISNVQALPDPGTVQAIA